MKESCLDVQMVFTAALMEIVKGSRIIIMAATNQENQFGDLVLEPICIGKVTQGTAISACQNFHQGIDIPPVGSHIQVTGSYVLDKEHSEWAEIHPITTIAKE